MEPKTKGKLTPYSLRAKAEFAAYQGLAAAVSLFGAGAVPVLEKYFPRIGEGFSHYLGRLPLPSKTPTIWVHGVSMGESLVAAGFAAEIKKKFPGYPLVFTSTHPDVLRTVKARNIADVVAYFPLDNVVAMKRAFSRWQPAAVFIAETDFWPAFSHVCHSRQIPLMLINGRISEKIARFYSGAVGLAEVVFSAFTSLMVQSEIDRERLLTIGVSDEKIEVVGNMKADLTAEAKPGEFAVVRNWVGERKLIVFGSLHPVEFARLKPAIIKLSQENVAMIIAPRNLKFCTEWAKELGSQKISTTFRTIPSPESSQVLILDTMGELAGMYGLGQAAFVGGSIDEKVGGHNPLEVIQQNIPLIMGCHNRNFADIVEQLQAADGIKICNDTDEFFDTFISLLTDHSKACSMAEKAAAVLEKNRGALLRTVERAGALICCDSSGE